MGLLLSALLVMFGSSALAQDGSSEGDPLGLIAGYEVTTSYSLGEDYWEVWICDSPEGDLEVSASEVAKVLESELSPYFRWLSDGRYRPVFRAGNPGVVEAPGFRSCLEAIEGQVEAGTEGVITIVDQETNFARGDPGYVSYLDDAGDSWQVEVEDTSYPANGRSVNAGGEMVLERRYKPEGLRFPLMSIIAHEFGHTLWFPHSYRFDAGEYDNPMDIMSDAEAAEGLQVGTVAINRYAAGWISQDDVAVYTGGTARYVLAPPGVAGTQMLVLPSGGGGFITLGARVRKGFDSGLPEEGVESYFIDTETSECGGSDLEPCYGLLRPTRAIQTNPTVPLDFEDKTAHVINVDDSFLSGEMSVRVVERRGDRFVVEVTDQPSTSAVPAPSSRDIEPPPDFYTGAYDADPLGLIAGFDVTTTYTLDDDLWQVWICESSEGYLDINAESAAHLLNSKLSPYFDQMSGGRYRPVFRVGGSVQISPSTDSEFGDCDARVADIIRARTSEEAPEGVMFIIDQVIFTSYGGLGDNDMSQSEILALNADVYPENNREVSLWGTVVASRDTIQWTSAPAWTHPYLDPEDLQDVANAAHEIGHALGFPHSGRFTQYDNPMDIMSRVEDMSQLQVGTIAINRYAAGWIDPSDVAIYEGGGRRTYRLSPPGRGNGIQMLIIRSDGSGYLALGGRVREGFDAQIPREGVEVYLIDEQSCGRFRSCVWEHRPTRAVIADPKIPLDFEDAVAHVMAVGDGFTTWNNISVEVVDRVGDDFVVEVSQASTDGDRLPQGWRLYGWYGWPPRPI